MNSSVLYPIFLSLAGRECTIVGLGSVGCRKLQGLLATDATQILVLDVQPFSELSQTAHILLRDGRARFVQGRFSEAGCTPGSLVFACTSDKEENLRIALACRKRHALCNCATDPEAGNFIVPAIARKGSLCAALSTGGQSPALSRKWREELEAWLLPREKTACFLGKLRAAVLALGLAQHDNSLIFRQIADAPLAEWLANDEIDSCLDKLRNILPKCAHIALDKAKVDF